MTRVLEIPQTQWVSFFRMLNRLAAGRPVRLEVIGRDLGNQEMSRRQPLREIDLELKGSACGELIIAVGDDARELMHLIEEPVGLALGLDELAAPEWLGIREAAGGTTIIYFERLPAIEAQYYTP